MWPPITVQEATVEKAGSLIVSLVLRNSLRMEVGFQFSPIIIIFQLQDTLVFVLSWIQINTLQMDKHLIF